MDDHEKLLQELEELESLRAYDAAKSSGDEVIPLDQALAEIEKHRLKHPQPKGSIHVSDTILYEQEGHVVTITYNRPERLNAINGRMREELNAAWLRFRDDTDAWVAILTGAGRAFCAGADIKEGGSAGTFAGTYWEKPTINSFESGLELFKPTIAAINGPCLGYGVTGVSFCDFVLASEHATFGFPEVRIGVPTIVGAIRMPGRIGWTNAMELLLIGEPVDAARAKEMGLVWKVVPHDDLLTRSESPGRPPLPIGAAGRARHQGSRRAHP